MPAERSHPERVVAQMLGDYVGCAMPPGKHVADEVGTDAMGQDGG